MRAIRSITKSFGKYLAVASINLRANIIYSVNALSRLPISCLNIWLLIELYRATYQTSGSAEIEGLTLTTALWNLILVQLFYSGSSQKLTKLINDEVLSGSLAYSVNKPYSYILFHYASFLGKTVPALFINGLVGLAFSSLFLGLPVFTLKRLFAGLLLLFLGYTLVFLIEFSIGLLAFWIDNSEPVRWIYTKFSIIFGGSIIPLQFLPGIVKTTAGFLPFGMLYYGPAQMAISGTPALFCRILFLQLLWIALGISLVQFIFHKGIKNVSLYGG